MTAVDQLAELEQTEAARAGTRYEELLNRLEAGEEIDPGKALRIMREAGKTSADADAELKRRRRVTELRLQIADVGDLADEQRQLRERQKTLKQEWEESDKRYRDELKAIDAKLMQINHRASDRDKAQRELRTLCPPPKDVQELEAAIRQCIGDIRRVESTLGPHDPEEKTAEAQRYAARIEELKAEYENTHPLLGIVKRSELRGRINALVEARDRAQTQADGSSRYRHQWAKLKALRARYAELEQQLRTLTTEG